VLYSYQASPKKRGGLHVQITKKIDEIKRPILRGRDIKRYGYKYADLWLINVHNGIRETGVKPIEINDFPAIKDHLDTFYKQIEKRSDMGITPYNLRNCAYMDDFSRQKLIWIELADKGRFAFDDQKYMTLNGTFIMTGKDLEFICSVLNNPISSWHFNTFCISSGVGTNQWRELYVRELFIPNFSDEQQKQIIDLFYEIMTLEKQQKPIVQKQKELDFLIYERLSLTGEEIDFIESQ